MSHKGGGEDAGKTSSITGTQRKCSQRLPVSTVPGPQERGSNETSTKFIMPGFLRTNCALQDGGYPSAKRHPQTKQLDDKSGP